MKLKHKQQLKSIEYSYTEYGYIATKDYKQYYHLKSLRKIIKLKNTNRILCAKRKSMYFNFNLLHATRIKGIDIRLVDHEKHNQYVSSIAKLSEQIGRNSAKIQRLRSSYTKFSDKWVDEKSRPKDLGIEDCF